MSLLHRELLINRNALCGKYICASIPNRLQVDNASAFHSLSLGAPRSAMEMNGDSQQIRDLINCTCWLLITYISVLFIHADHRSPVRFIILLPVDSSFY